MLRNKILLLLFCICYVNLGIGQIKNNGIPFISNFTTKDDVKISKTWSIVQDKRGILYFGTSNGIMEFDGFNWSLLKMSNSSEVRSLAIDKTGRIFIGGFGEIGYLAADKTGKLSYKSLLNKLPPNKRNFNYIYKVGCTKDGVIFQSHFSLLVYAHDTIEVHEINKNLNYAHFVNDKVFVHNVKQGLFLFEKNKFISINKGDLLRNNEVTDVLAYGDNHYLIVTLNDGFYLYDGVSVSKWNSQIDEFLKGNQVYTAINLNKGLIAVGTVQKGLVVINQNGVIVQQLDKSNGLQNNTVIALFKDRYNNLWCGLDYGIDYIHISSPFSYYNDSKGLMGAVYSTLAYKGKIYAGTNQGLFYKPLLNYENPLDASAEFKLIPNSKTQIWHLDTIENNLVCGNHQGTFKVDDGHVSLLSDIEGGWTFLKLQRQKDYYLEGTYTGLLLYQKTGDGKLAKINFVRKIKGFLESCRYLVQDDQGYIWMSHVYKGVYRLKLNQKLDSIVSIKVFGKSQGLPSDCDNNIFKLNNKVIVSTNFGVYSYNFQTEKFEQDAYLNKLLGKDKTANFYLQDNDMNIWYSNKGVLGVLMNQTDNSYKLVKTPFFKIHDIVLRGFENISFSPQGNVFIGTRKGIVHFNTMDLNTVNYGFNVWMRKVMLTKAHDSILFGGAFVDDKENIVLKQNSIPEISYRLNAVKFNFSASFYENIEDMKYEYFLDGFDHQWSDWQKENYKEYTNLPEGHYVFHVRAKNIYQTVSSDATFEFVVDPPFYRTIWAFLIYLILISGVVYFTINNVKERFQREKDRIEEEKKIALQRKEEQRISEVLKAEKEIIKLKAEKLEGDLEHNNKELASVIMNNSRKNELLNQLKRNLQLIYNETNLKVRKTLDQIIHMIDYDIDIDDNWAHFELLFDKVHQNFIKKLKDNYPDLTESSLKLCAYMRMKLSTKEIANLMNISVSGVEKRRYRLRKALNLDPEVNLNDFLDAI